jgi:hypothetical protein
MTDRTQFEAMLEALINEDQETAKEIFHNIVVAKSREIYEELLESDFMEDGDDEDKEQKDEAVDDEEDTEANPFGADDSEEDDAEADDAEGEEDDADADSEEDPFGSEEEGEGDMEDRVMDLEDALDELKAEFEQLMADEEGEEHMGGDDMGGMDAMGGDDLEMETGDEFDPTTNVMEYTKKVGLPKHGDNGANARSIVAKPNRMGGTSANIAKNFSTEKGGTEGGLASPKAGDLTSGLGKIHNRKDSNAGKTAFKKTEPGHGAEKKGKGEVGGVDKKSLIGGRN